MNKINRLSFLSILNTTIKEDAIEKPNASEKSQVLFEVKTSNFGLKTYKEYWGEAQIFHLLRRTLFGVTIEDYAFFKNKSLEESIDILLTPTPLPLPPVNTYNDSNFTDPDVPFGKTWVHASFGNPEGEQDGRRVQNLKGWWIGLMIAQNQSITEKMTLFWSNHIGAQMYLMKDARLDYTYIEMLRSFALGNFKKLIGKATINPGILEYLNGNVNTAKAPNENYSRELQELYTVGKGPDSHYTESDVKEAARVLTGWKINDKPGGVSSYFDDANHDKGDKKFSNFYNNKVIKGRTGVDGAKETDELINMIFEKKEVAKYTCRNLYRWFVYYHINSTIEENIITPLSEIFIQNNFEIKPVLKALLSSEHFFDPIHIGCQIKNPIEHLIGTCRQLGIYSPQEDPIKQHSIWELIAYRLKETGMDPGDPPNVAGWPATYQFPSFSELWINSLTLSKRNELTDALSSNNGLSNEKCSTHFLLLQFTSMLNNPANPNELIAESIKLLFASSPSAEHIKTLKEILLSSQKSDQYWTDAWNAYFANPEDEMKQSIVLNRLRPFYAYILQRSEFQLQ
jgi:uncharacterized protein (DUF1800 family)